MYRYKGCRYPYPHRLTGDGHRILMAGIRIFGRKPNSTRQVWTDDDNESLIEMYRKCKPISYIADVLDRDDDIVKAHVLVLIKRGKLEQRHNIQVKRSQQRRAFIQRHFQERGIDFCMRHLGLTRKTVQKYAEQAGITKKRQYVCWSIQDEEFLRTHYRSKGFEYCAHKLGRSYQAVRCKANDMGLTQARGAYRVA